MAPIHSSIPPLIENGSTGDKSTASSIAESSLQSIRFRRSQESPDTIASSQDRRLNQMVSIPNTYGELDTSPEPGVVAGIVLGTVGGVILILYLLYLIFGRKPARVVDDGRSRSRSRSPYIERSEMSEVTRSRSRTPLPRSRSRRDTVVVEESYTASSAGDEDDVVEVFEEHSPSPPRRGGGYRTVDPYEYGGGGRPMRNVRR